ncbi:MAG: efflux RND transporter permease subunit, partial [Spirochaetota bacterium]
RYRSMAVAGMLLLASMILLPRLRVDLSTDAVLGRRFEYVRELMYVSRSEIGAGGFYNIDLLFGAKPGAESEAEPLATKYLEQLAEFERRLRETGLVKNITSVVTFIQSTQSIYRGHRGFPQELEQTKRALLTWERVGGGELSRWYSEGDKSLRMMVQVRQASSRENIAHMEAVRNLAAEVFSPEVEALPFGGVFQLAVMNQFITKGLLRSFSLSLVLVAILLLILLRSLRLGLIALIPNLFPVLLTGGLVAAAGRSLEFVSMTVGPMLIGLAADDTIYFLGHVQSLLRREGPSIRATKVDRVIKRSLYQVAPALVTTTMILCVLFASLLLSQAANIRYMGLYTIIAMLAALLSDLCLTPILLRRWFGRN